MVSAALPSLNTCRRSDMEKQRGDRRLSLRRDILSSWRFLSAASVGCLTSYYLFLGQPGAPILVLPLLRSAAVVKGLHLPRKVRDYFETMMGRIGYQPLPTV